MTSIIYTELKILNEEISKLSLNYNINSIDVYFNPRFYDFENKNIINILKPVVLKYICEIDERTNKFTTYTIMNAYLELIINFMLKFESNNNVSHNNDFYEFYDELNTMYLINHAKEEDGKCE